MDKEGDTSGMPLLISRKLRVLSCLAMKDHEELDHE